MARFSIPYLGLLYLCCWAAIADAKVYAKYKDPKLPIASRIKDLLNRMTLAEKIGQITQIERKNATFDVMKNFFIGSVLSGGGSAPKTNDSAADWVNMVNEIQKGSLSTRLGIPMIYGIDAVHGHSIC
ncbi:Glycosyl hydrolase family protein, partial [Thalictrum thalictroides]